MSGAWEQDPHRTVLVAVLSVDIVSTKWALGLKRLQIPGQIITLAGMPYDMSRNVACEQALQNGFKYLYFLDSDVIPPPDTIHRLISHNLPIVGGTYFRRSPPAGVPVAMRATTYPDGNKGFQWVTQLPPTGLVPVDVMGAGCLLLRRDLLQKVQQKPQRPGKTFFDWRVDMNNVPGWPREKCLSEDYTLNIHLKEQFNITTYLDCSIRCEHVGLASAGYGTFQPLDTNAVVS